MDRRSSPLKVKSKACTYYRHHYSKTTKRKCTQTIVHGMPGICVIVWEVPGCYGSLYTLPTHELALTEVAVPTRNCAHWRYRTLGFSSGAPASAESVSARCTANSHRLEDRMPRKCTCPDSNYDSSSPAENTFTSTIYNNPMMHKCQMHHAATKRRQWTKQLNALQSIGNEPMN